LSQVSGNLTNLHFSTGSADYMIGNTIITFEYNRFQYDIEIIFGSSELDPVPMDTESYYLNVSHRFTDLFEMGVFYSESYRSADDKDGKKAVENNFADYEHDGWDKDLCLSLRFDLNENWILKFEGHYIDGTFRAAAAEPETEPEAADTFSLFAGKVSYSF